MDKGFENEIRSRSGIEVDQGLRVDIRINEGQSFVEETCLHEGDHIRPIDIDLREEDFIQREEELQGREVKGTIGVIPEE